MKRSRFSIAVTGGIGSGKSLVCNWFADQGLTVISADKLGHEALRSPLVQKALTAEFGENILEEGIINRQKLGDLVFDNEANTGKLNAITHPYIIDRIKELIKTQKDKMMIYEIPLLFEAGLENLFDIIIMVWASENVRKERLLTGRKMTESKIKAIMHDQFPQEAARTLADHVIENNGSINELKGRLKNLLETLKTKELK